MTILGADISAIGTQPLIDLSAKCLGAKPAFFGRYFKAAENTDPVQYQSLKENALFHKSNIRILCIGRQTNHVNGSAQTGAQDGANNAQAVIKAFGADYVAALGYAPIIFLDTEPENPMNADYYVGWAGALTKGVTSGNKQITFTPAVYVNQSDNPTWNAIGEAMKQGAACAGAWVADYGDRTGDMPPPAWDDAQINPTVPLPCKILAWQYAGDYDDDTVDFSIVNPNAENVVGLMILPPGT